MMLSIIDEKCPNLDAGDAARLNWLKSYLYLSYADLSILFEKSPPHLRNVCENLSIYGLSDDDSARLKFYCKLVEGEVETLYGRPHHIIMFNRRKQIVQAKKRFIIRTLLGEYHAYMVFMISQKSAK